MLASPRTTAPADSLGSKCSIGMLCFEYCGMHMYMHMSMDMDMYMYMHMHTHMYMYMYM